MGNPNLSFFSGFTCLHDSFLCHDKGNAQQTKSDYVAIFTLESVYGKLSNEYQIFLLCAWLF